MKPGTIFILLKLIIALPVIVLLALAYSSLFPAGNWYVVFASIILILLGMLLSTGSAGRVISLAMVLYTVPYAIGASQFIPIAFPETYRQVGERILTSPYFSNFGLSSLFLLMGLSLMTDYVEGAEEWEKVLAGLGKKRVGLKTLAYSLTVLSMAFILSWGLLSLGERLPLRMGGIVLPVILFAVGMAVAYGSIVSGKYKKIVLAVEVKPQGGGEVIVQTREGEKRFPISPSAAFEWEMVRFETELMERPLGVFLKREERRKRLAPLIENVDGETLFLLYREEG
ncbi:hypothetical protein E3E23_05365 [Thermococcus sp. CX2]|uniref:hypothetical protein n=1 Tax=Thermococcus sp. CX2 TaxID=163006 RepID=UPI001439E245|nr:hypothetical protein [Thermococcus sp. CX2]NJE85253.1 hypothetical protein [Thermococcus sp. CX2]